MGTTLTPTWTHSYSHQLYVPGATIKHSNIHQYTNPSPLFHLTLLYLIIHFLSSTFFFPLSSLPSQDAHHSLSSGRSLTPVSCLFSGGRGSCPSTPPSIRTRRLEY
jgi:hypothetical protein